MGSTINVLWAVNPIDIDRNSVSDVKSFLDLSSQKLKIYPVYVASPRDLEIESKLFRENFSSFKRGARIKLKSLFKDFTDPDSMSDVKVLSHLGADVEGAVDRLLGYSKNLKTDFILLGVSKKSQSQKKKFGSFSKELLKRSENSSIAIGLIKKVKKAKPKFLFATDLSHDSILDMIKFSRLSKQMGSELTFVKKGYFESESHSKKRLAQFSKLAKKCGVKATYAELRNANPSADELAAYAAKNNFTLMGLSCSVLNSI